MAKEFFKDLPNTTTPLTAERLNGLLDGEEALGNIVVDSIRSKNIFNEKLLIPNAYVVSGVITSNNDNDIYVIKVTPNTKYTLSKTSYNGGVLGYYSTFPKIGDTLTNRQSLANVSNLTITAQDNYLCLMIAKADSKNTIQVELGESATTYTPYQELGTDNFKNEEIVVGSIKSKNMFGNYAVINGWIYGTGMRVNSTNGNRMAFIPCKANTTYTISRTAKTSSFRVGDYNTIPTMTGTNVDYTLSKSCIDDDNGTIITYTTSSTAKYLIIHYANIGTDSESTVAESLATIQVEEGSIATNYMPYGRLFNPGSDVIVAGSTSTTTLNGNTDLDYNVSLNIPDGYKAIGIVGYYIHGAYSTRLTISGFYLYNSTTAKFIGRNMGNDTATLAIDVFVLCIKM